MTIEGGLDFGAIDDPTHMRQIIAALRAMCDLAESQHDARGGQEGEAMVILCLDGPPRNKRSTKRRLGPSMNSPYGVIVGASRQWTLVRFSTNSVRYYTNQCEHGHAKMAARK